MLSKIKIKFGVIEHGWYPITFITDEVEYVIDASDVPVDPVLELINAIETVCIGGTQSEAWFSLEPYFYQMVFAPEGEQTKVSLNYVDEQGVTVKNESKGTNRPKEFSCVVNTNQLLVELCRGLKELGSMEPRYFSQIQELEEALKKANQLLRQLACQSPKLGVEL